MSTDPTPTGYSEKGLARLHDVMTSHVESGEVPGLVTLVSRRGEVHVDALGAMAIGGPPMRRDTIFRISSMTKPIASAAAMILVEDDKLRLDESVERLLPELANRRVLKKLDGPLDDTVPAQRPITVRDLLTFRLGFGLVWGPQDALPIQKAAIARELQAFGPPKPQLPPAPDEWMRRFATLPLMHQPGEQWMYTTGSEILGVLLERAAGAPLETFLRHRIFEPLEMKDTGFHVPAENIDRLATSYMADPKTSANVLYDPARGGEWSRPPSFPSCAGGLVSTIDDFFAFTQMMSDGGTFRGRRLLSKVAIETMTTDQLTPAQKAASDGSLAPGFFDTHGWGIGVSIATKRDSLATSIGRYGWDGGLGTSWYSDPKRGLVGILMTQRGAYPTTSPVYRDFWTAAYDAIAVD